jgi:hypothetical protein
MARDSKKSKKPKGYWREHPLEQGRRHIARAWERIGLRDPFWDQPPLPLEWVDADDDNEPGPKVREAIGLLQAAFPKGIPAELTPQNAHIAACDECKNRGGKPDRIKYHNVYRALQWMRR